jgi:hypothetical protein
MLVAYGNNDASYFENPKGNEVKITTPSVNTRQITASIVVDCTVDDVVNIISDYNNLVTHVPNLIQSYLVPSPNINGIRLFQEGSQKIIGFDFRASLTMDMVEDFDDENRTKVLRFKLVESKMFSAFDGYWSARHHSRVRKYDNLKNEFTYDYKTLLQYSVYVEPRGRVPVIALEWRIKEDVPINLQAVKAAAEKAAAEKLKLKTDNLFLRDNALNFYTGFDYWGQDETLGSYI